MLMHDINLLLPSAIRTMRSSLKDIGRQQIPFTAEGLSRLGLPEKFARELRAASDGAEQERLAAACFIAELFDMNHEDYAARESLERWLSTHGGAKAGAMRARVRRILEAWSEEEFGPGRPASVEAADEPMARASARSFIYRLF